MVHRVSGLYEFGCSICAVLPSGQRGQVSHEGLTPSGNRSLSLSLQMDDELQETVEAILGKGVTVLDCEKRSCVREEEVLLVNGVPVPLDCAEGAAIREALLRNSVPHCDLLNKLLLRAGILRAPVRLEAELSVKSSVVTREEVTVARAGHVVDERSRETKEDSFYTSSSSEVWEPVGVVRPSRSRSDASTSTGDASPPPRYYPPTALRGGATASSSSSVDEGVGGSPLRNGMRDCSLEDVVDRAPPRVQGVQATTSAVSSVITNAKVSVVKNGFNFL